MFPERKSQDIFKTLDTSDNILERYNTSKLMQLMAMKKLAAACGASGKGQVIINSLNPGLCKTQLFRRWETFPLNLLINAVKNLLGREPEMGSRTLMTAAFAGEETHGEWMTDCRLHARPGLMKGDDGDRLTSKVWEELVAILEGIEPGSTQNI